MVLLGFLFGAVLAGGVVWWLVAQRPPTKTVDKPETTLPPGVSPEDAAREYFQKGRDAKDGR